MANDDKKPLTVDDIRPPVPRFVGMDWSKVKPSNGDAHKDRLLAERFRRSTDDR